MCGIYAVLRTWNGNVANIRKSIDILWFLRSREIGRDLTGQTRTNVLGNLVSKSYYIILKTEAVYVYPKIWYIYQTTLGHAAGGAVSWGNALQAGRSRVRFPMLSLEFFIDIKLPAALWPWVRLSL